MSQFVPACEFDSVGRPRGAEIYAELGLALILLLGNSR